MPMAFSYSSIYKIVISIFSRSHYLIVPTVFSYWSNLDISDLYFVYLLYMHKMLMIGVYKSSPNLEHFPNIELEYPIKIVFFCQSVQILLTNKTIKFSFLLKLYLSPRTLLKIFFCNLLSPFSIQSP